MIEADTPNLWEIRRHTDHASAIGVVVIALIHTARLVNVENNLNETQIGEIANDVLEDYGYLKVEEVKYILKSAVRSRKIFGRLDYNVVMNWFADYDAEHTEEAMRASDQEALQRQHELRPAEDAISWGEYIERLWNLAYYADPQAVETLWQIQQMQAASSVLLSEAERRQKEIKFKQVFYQYIKAKK